MYKQIFIGMACLSIFLLQATENLSLIVGTNAEFPPFSYIENKMIVGFDIDVAKEVAQRPGKQIQFKDMPFDALIPDLILGHLDFAAAGMSYTEERAKRVSFTKPYLSGDPLVIFTRSKQNLNLDDLQGKTVIVIEGFTADFFMSNKLGVNLVRLPTQTDGFMAIKSGRADAFVTAQSTVNAFFKKQDKALYHINIIEETSETCALVIPKSKPNLLIDVQNALDDMQKDGTLDKLKEKWGFND